jgi:molybdate transport system substrate-binding protein
MNRRIVLGFLLAGFARPAMAQHHGAMSSVSPTPGSGVLVFAAATLKPALDEIVSAYRSKQGGDVTVAYGPTPALAKQVEEGAPADIFLSADPVWMDYLVEKRLIRRHTRVDLVRNTLVLAGRSTQSPQAARVVDGSFPLVQVIGDGRLSMCNPADHPAGRYAKASLEKLGLWDSVAGRIAIADNPQAAMVLVARGEAPAAVVFATDVKGVAGTQVLATFPESSHPPIVYPAAVTMNAPHADAADKLLAYLRSPEVRTQFDGFGYG